MKISLLLSIVLAASLLPATGQEYTLHEWGTFTSVIGSDGTHLDGVEREDAPLPRFVYAIDTPPPRTGAQGLTKGIAYTREFAHVNVRLETPVIYFYTDTPFDAQVDVRFKNGTIGQWYPDRSAGEERQEPGSALDFAIPREGSIRWDVRVEPAGDDQAARVFRSDELPCWIYPRLPDSALVTNAQNETEKYLFYRGLGRMELPVVFTASDEELRATNHGKEEIAEWLVFDLNHQGMARWWSPKPIECTETSGVQSVTVNRHTQPYRNDWKKALYDDGVAMLMRAGLYRKEADAMMQTWWTGYFETPGLRVFWIVPRTLVDEVLPLAVSPTPAAIERVIVGRAEILTPSFEQRLVRDFSESGDSNPWQYDRFFPAYSARVRQLEESSAE